MNSAIFMSRSNFSPSMFFKSMFNFNLTSSGMDSGLKMDTEKSSSSLMMAVTWFVLLLSVKL